MRLLLILLISNFSLSQNSDQVFDSIIKYKQQRPSLALEYGFEYSKITFDRKPDLETVQFNGAMGEILSFLGFDATALEYLTRAIKLHETLPADNRKFPEINELPGVLLIIGNIYFKNQQYDKADEIFSHTISLYEKIKDEEAKFFGINTAMSNRALIKEVKKDYTGAEKIHLEVLERRKEYGKVVDIIYSINSISSILLIKNETVEAKKMLDSAQNFYIKEIENGNNNPILNRNMGYGFFSFGYIMQYKKEFEKAIIYLNKSKTYLKDFPSDLAAIGSRLAECNLGLNNIEEAEKIAIKNLQFKNLNEQEKTYNYRVLEKIYKRKKMDKKLLMVKDSLILMATGFSKIKTTKSLNNFETEIKLANSSRELNESKIKHNTYLYISIICFIILISAIFGIRINYNLQKEVASRLEAEKKLISSELSQKNRELVSKTNFILQRNEYLKKIQGKLDSDQFNTDETKSVAFNLNSVISSEKLYKDFDKMFVNVYPNFYMELNKVAKLSTTDLRLASLIKMNHNNNEIAIISGVSLRTIESQRYRLSKKLKLKKNQSLNSLLLAI
jgi:tetratricopeptide (TPR) repeat protein